MINLNQIIVLFISLILIIFLFLYFKYPTLVLLLIFKKPFSRSATEYIILFLCILLNFFVSSLFAFNYGYDLELDNFIKGNIGETDAIIYESNLKNITQEEVEKLQNVFLVENNVFESFIPAYINYAKINNSDTVLLKLEPKNLLSYSNNYNLYLEYNNLDSTEVIISRSLADKKNVKESDIIEVIFNNSKFLLKVKKIFNDDGLLGFDFPVYEFSNNIVGSIMVSQSFFEKNFLNETGFNFFFIRYNDSKLKNLEDFKQFELNSKIKNINNNLIFFELRRFFLNQIHNNLSIFSLSQFALILFSPLILLILVFIAFFIKDYIAPKNLNKLAIESQILKNNGLSYFSLFLINQVKFVILSFFASLVGYFLSILFGNWLKYLLVQYFLDFIPNIFLEVNLSFNFDIFLYSSTINVIVVFLVCLIIFFTGNFFSSNFCLSKLQLLPANNKSKWYLFDFNSFLFIGLFVIIALYLWYGDIVKDVNLRYFLFYFLFTFLLVFLTYKSYNFNFISRTKFILISSSLCFVSSVLSFFIFDSLMKQIIFLPIIPFIFIMYSMFVLLITWFKHTNIFKLTFIPIKVFYEKIFLTVFSAVLSSFILFCSLIYIESSIKNHYFNPTILTHLNNFIFNTVTIYNPAGNLDFKIVKDEILPKANEAQFYFDQITPVRFEFNSLTDYLNLNFAEINDFEKVNCLLEQQDCLDIFLNQNGIVLSSKLYYKLISNLKPEKDNESKVNKFNVKLTYLNGESFYYPVIGYLTENYEFNHMDLLVSKNALQHIPTDISLSKIIRIVFDQNNIEERQNFVNYMKSAYGKSIIVIDNSVFIKNLTLFISKINVFIILYLIIFYITVVLLNLLDQARHFLIQLNYFNNDFMLFKKVQIVFSLVIVFILLILLNLMFIIGYGYFYLNYYLNIKIVFDLDVLLNLIYNFGMINLFTIATSIFFVLLFDNAKKNKETLYFRY